MILSSHVEGDALIIRAEERRIDAMVAIQFKDAMRAVTADCGAAGAGAAARVVLDLGQVDFVDSSGLGAIVAVMKFLAPGLRLELAALQPNVSRVFHLTRMDTVFTIHDVPPGPGQVDAA
jgi:anti-sigma B factor antagonist